MPLSATIESPLAFVLGAAETVEPFFANLAGLPPARNGKMFIDGELVTGRGANRVVMIGRDAQLVGHTPREHLRNVCAWRGVADAAARAEAMLSEHQHSDLLDRNVVSLSQTDRKRVRFAEMAALNPTVTVVLAPFAGLGPEDAKLAMQALAGQRGGTVLVYEVSGGEAHMLAAAVSAPAIVMLAPDSLVVSPFARAPHPHVVRAMTSEAKRLAAALNGVPDVGQVQAFDAMVVVWGEERAAIARAIARASHEHGIALGAMQ